MTKDWLCELGCWALHMTKKWKIPALHPEPSNPAVWTVSLFYSLEWNQASLRRKSYHNSKDSMGEEECYPEASFNVPFPFPFPPFSSRSVQMFIPPICEAPAMYTYRIKSGFSRVSPLKPAVWPWAQNLLEASVSVSSSEKYQLVRLSQLITHSFIHLFLHSLNVYWIPAVCQTLLFLCSLNIYWATYSVYWAPTTCQALLLLHTTRFIFYLPIKTTLWQFLSLSSCYRWWNGSKDSWNNSGSHYQWVVELGWEFTLSRPVPVLENKAHHSVPNLKMLTA